MVYRHGAALAAPSDKENKFDAQRSAVHGRLQVSHTVQQDMRGHVRMPVSERAPCLRHSAEVSKLARRPPGHLLRAACQRLQGSVPRTARSCLACVSMRRTARPRAAGCQNVPRASAQHARWARGEFGRSTADWCHAPRESEKNPNDEVPRPVRPYGRTPECSSCGAHVAVRRLQPHRHASLMHTISEQGARALLEGVWPARSMAPPSRGLVAHHSAAARRALP